MVLVIKIKIVSQSAETSGDVILGRFLVGMREDFLGRIEFNHFSQVEESRLVAHAGRLLLLRAETNSTHELMNKVMKKRMTPSRNSDW